MSRKNPVLIDVRNKIVVDPDSVFESEVVRYGNGAMIKAYKRFIGRECVVLIKKKKKSNIESDLDSASGGGWKNP